MPSEGEVTTSRAGCNVPIHCNGQSKQCLPHCGPTGNETSIVAKHSACLLGPFLNDISPAGGTVLLDCNIRSACPGFLEMCETAEEGAAREAKEELNAEVDVEGLMAVYCLPHIGQMCVEACCLVLCRVVLCGEDGGCAVLSVLYACKHTCCCTIYTCRLPQFSVGTVLQRLSPPESVETRGTF